MAEASRIPEVIDALYSSWSADAAITTLGDDCAVFDGPYVADNSSAYRLFVGGTGLDDDEDPAATSLQLSPHAADVARDEEIRVQCAAWFTAADVDNRTAREAARDLLNRAVSMPRSTQNLGLENVFYVGFDEIQMRQASTKDGASVVFTFTAVVRCRIYS